MISVRSVAIAAQCVYAGGSQELPNSEEEPQWIGSHT